MLWPPQFRRRIRAPSNRSLALAVVLLTLIGAWPRFDVMGAILLVDGVALVLIYFPDTIDDLTFGTYVRGGLIDSHTPPFLIAAFGWVIMLTLAAVLYWPRHRV